MRRALPQRFRSMLPEATICTVRFACPTSSTMEMAGTLLWTWVLRLRSQSPCEHHRTKDKPLSLNPFQFGKTLQLLGDLHLRVVPLPSTPLAKEDETGGGFNLSSCSSWWG